MARLLSQLTSIKNALSHLVSDLFVSNANITHYNIQSRRCPMVEEKRGGGFCFNKNVLRAVCSQRLIVQDRGDVRVLQKQQFLNYEG